MLLLNAPRLEGSPYVVPAIFKPAQPMSQNTYSKGWKRILARAKITHVGTHGTFVTARRLRLRTQACR